MRATHTLAIVLWAVLLTVVSGLLGPDVQATSLGALNLGELAAQSELIFVGYVLSVASGPDVRGLPATRYAFQVEQVLKGSALQPGQVFSFKQFGLFDGQGEQPFDMPGFPRFRVQRRYALFLTGESGYGFRNAVGMGQGAFAVSQDGGIENAFENGGLLRSAGHGVDLVIHADPAQGDDGSSAPSPLTLKTLVERLSPLPGIRPRGEVTPELQPLPSASIPAPAAGPLNVHATSAKPYVWSIPTASNPGNLDKIPYNPDRGNLGTLSNSEARVLVAEAFGIWEAVPTAFVLKPVIEEGSQLSNDITGTNFDQLLQQDNLDGINPIVFDSNGAITDALNGVNASCSILGFASPSDLADNAAAIQEAFVVLNGMWIDGQSNVGKCGREIEVSIDVFKGVMVHEFGHYLGLDHTQVNGDAYLKGENVLGFGVPPLNSVATMFPLVIGQGLDTLAFDDQVAISTLYPSFNFLALGKIKGKVLEANGVTPFQCANVIARKLDDPFFTASSNVSGALFTFGGSSSIKGDYVIAGLPFGDYAVEMDQINSLFDRGSSVGPCDPPRVLPGSQEYYNGAQESSNPASDDPGDFSPVSVNGQVQGINIILNLGGSTINATRTITPSTLGKGGLFTVHIEINTPQSLLGAAIQEHLPPGWEVIHHQGSLNATFNDATFEWLVLSFVNDGDTLDYTVQVPENAAIKNYQITGTLRSANPEVTLDIEGSASVQIIECVPLSQYAAQMSEPFDMISTQEILEAVGWWLESASVEGTCEGIVNTPAILTLVAYWKTETPVDQPLPLASASQGWRLPQGDEASTENPRFNDRSDVPATPVTLRTTQRLGHVDFNVQATGVRATEVQIYGLDGRLVTALSGQGPSLQWNLSGRDGRLVPNGVYLYRAVVHLADGKGLRIGVRKMVVLR